jgi:hypothetical protein
MNKADQKKQVAELQESPEALAAFVKAHYELEATAEQSKAEAEKVPTLETELVVAIAEADKVPGLETELATAKAEAEKVTGLEADLATAKAEADKVPDLEARAKTQSDLIKELNQEKENETESTKKESILEIEKESFKVALARFRVPGFKDRVFGIDDLKKNQEKVTIYDKKDGKKVSKEISLQDWAIAKGVIVKQNAK